MMNFNESLGEILNLDLGKRSILFCRTSSSHNAFRVKTESGQDPGK